MLYRLPGIPGASMGTYQSTDQVAVKCIARLKRRLSLETMWLAGGAGLRPGFGGREHATPSRLPAGIGATRAGFAWSTTFEHSEPRRGDRLARAGERGENDLSFCVFPRRAG